MGKRLMGKGDATAAATYFETAHRMRPSDYGIACDLGLTYLSAGRLDESRAILSSTMAEQNTAELHNILGRVESAAKNYVVAATEYQIAAQMDPSEQYIFDFGSSLLKIDYGSAVTIFRAGIDRFPRSVKLHVGLGAAFYDQDRVKEGTQQMRIAADIDPSDPHPLEFIARTESIPQGMAEEITARYAAMHRKYPQNGEILFDYAMSSAGRWSGKPKSTPPGFVDHLKQAITLDPKLAPAHFQLGSIYADEGNYQEAMRSYERAVKLDPTEEQYHYQLAFTYKKLGNQRRFSEELAAFLQIHNGSTH